MKGKLLKAILSKYFDIVEENIEKGHYVETDFRNYSELVERSVEAAKNDDTIFFTALGNPLYQWFNFNIKNPGARSVSETGHMESDPTWTAYIKFIHTLATNRINIHRCVFCASDEFTNRRYLLDLIENSKIEAQKNSYIIFKIENKLEPLDIEEIRILLGDKIENKYKCYKDVKSAYLIIDSESDVVCDTAKYQCERLWDHFSIFQPTGQLTTWIYKKEHAFNKDFPEDFFLIGTGKKLAEAKWSFALGGDVSKDHKKVRLWFVADDMPALEKDEKGKYKIRFDFNELIDFVNNYIIFPLHR